MSLSSIFRESIERQLEKDRLKEGFNRVMEALEEQRRLYVQAREFERWDNTVDWTSHYVSTGKISDAECRIYHALKIGFNTQTDRAIDTFYKGIQEKMAPEARVSFQTRHEDMWMPTPATIEQREMLTASVCIKLHDGGALVQEQMNMIDKMRKKKDPLSPGFFKRLFG